MKNIINLPIGYKLLVLQTLAIVFLLLFWKGCGDKKIITSEEQILKSELYIEGKQKYEKSLNKLGQELTTQKEVLINRDKQLEKLLLENSNLKELNSQIKFSTETRIDDLIVDWNKDVNYLKKEISEFKLKDGDTVYSTRVDTVGIGIGTKFSESDQWYSISGTIEKVGLKLDSIKFNNSYTITIGTKRKSLFKKPETLVELKTDNPYTKSTSLNNIKVVEKKPWFNGGMKIGTGFIIGCILTFLIIK